MGKKSRGGRLMLFGADDYFSVLSDGHHEGIVDFSPAVFDDGHAAAWVLGPVCFFAFYFLAKRFAELFPVGLTLPVGLRMGAGIRAFHSVVALYHKIRENGRGLGEGLRNHTACDLDTGRAFGRSRDCAVPVQFDQVAFF